MILRTKIRINHKTIVLRKTDGLEVECYILLFLGAVHVEVSWPVRRAGSPRCDDFYPTFIWYLLSQFNKKFIYVIGKRLFDQVVFTINSDVKPLCRANVLILFN